MTIESRTTSTVWRCDRSGTEATVVNDDVEVLPAGWESLVATPLPGSRFDLCPDCLVAFNIFMGLIPNLVPPLPLEPLP